MTTTSKRKAAANLRVVASKTSGPDLEALDRVLTETAQQMAPMVSRTGSARERMKAEIAVLEADKAAVKARRQLVERHYNALCIAFDSEEADINAAIASYRQGLGDGVGE